MKKYISEAIAAVLRLRRTRLALVMSATLTIVVALPGCGEFDDSDVGHSDHSSQRELGGQGSHGGHGGHVH